MAALDNLITWDYSLEPFPQGDIFRHSSYYAVLELVNIKKNLKTSRNSTEKKRKKPTNKLTSEVFCCQHWFVHSERGFNVQLVSSVLCACNQLAMHFNSLVPAAFLAATCSSLLTSKREQGAGTGLCVHLLGGVVPSAVRLWTWFPPPFSTLPSSQL